MNCQAECPNPATHLINGTNVCYPHYLPLARSQPIDSEPELDKLITKFILAEFPYGAGYIDYAKQQKLRAFIESVAKI